MTKFQGPVSARRQRTAKLYGRIAASRNPGPEPGESDIPDKVINEMFSVFSLDSKAIINITGLSPRQIKEISVALARGETPNTEEFIGFRNIIEKRLRVSKERE